MIFKGAVSDFSGAASLLVSVPALVPPNVYLQLVNSVVWHVVNTRHKPACVSQFPSTFTPCSKSAHPYQNKGFVSQPFSHTCAHLRLQPLCFDTLHKNTRGEGVPPEATVSSRIGRGNAPTPKRAERFLAARTPLEMTATSKGEKNPGTGLKTGHYRPKREASASGRDGIFEAVGELLVLFA